VRDTPDKPQWAVWESDKEIGLGHESGSCRKAQGAPAGASFWGYGRMTAWLKFREGFLVNRKRIRRLMRENGPLVEQVRHKALRASKRGKPKATRPNQYWEIDMTKFFQGPLGWCYLIVVLDWYTKEIVGRNLSLRGKSSD